MYIYSESTPARTFSIKHLSLYQSFAIDPTKMTAIDPGIGEKAAAAAEPSEYLPSAHEDLAVGDVNSLKRNLKNRHMQMIAVGMYVQFYPNILTLT
jgi:hypothetical protein